MGYKVGTHKRQLSLLPACLDDYIPENHICRVISAFAEQLDICAPEFKYAEWKDKGCRPYDPRMMLNLYIYGYLHRVRSSRRLEAETEHRSDAACERIEAGRQGDLQFSHGQRRGAEKGVPGA
jgi:transposase